VLTFPDGSRYEGMFAAGKRHGTGTCRDGEGKWGICEFADDKFLRWVSARPEGPKRPR